MNIEPEAVAEFELDAEALVCEFRGTNRHKIANPNQ